MKRLSQTVKVGLALLVALFSNGLLPAAHASAYSMTNPGNHYKKVYVCKYVGTPGQNERLQTGGNPINVSVNAIQNFQGIGSYFNDQQGRSFVVAWDSGDGQEPPVSMCPAPAPDVIPIPATPAINDLCGTGNAAWAVPANTTAIHWSLNNQNHLIATAQTGYKFPNNQSTYDFGVAPETNTAPCIVKLPKPLLQINDPCGVNNATWNVPGSSDYTIQQNANRSVTLTAGSNRVFDDGSANGVKSYTVAAPQDSGALCQSEPVPTPAPVDPCGLGNAYWIIPHDTAKVDWSLNGGILTATAIGVLFQDGRSVISFGTAPDSGKLCSVKLPHTPDTDDPCGPANATWDMPHNTHEYTWSLSAQGHLIATTTANYVFSNGQTSHDFGVAPDSNQPCPVSITQPTCDVDGSMTLTLPAYYHHDYYYEVTTGIGFPVIYDDDDLPVTITGISQGATVRVKLVRDGHYKKVIFVKDYSFDMLNCIEIPEAPAPADSCGVANASWTIPEDSSSIKWSLNDSDELIATAVGSLFEDGTSTHNYGVAKDSNTLCAPTAPEVTVYCGLYNNDQVMLPEVDEDAGYHWVSYWKGDTLVAKAIAHEGNQFDEETQTKWRFTDEHTACEMPELSTTPKTCLDSATVTVKYDAERYYYTIQLGDGEELPLDSGTTKLAKAGTYTVRGYEYRSDAYDERVAIVEDQEDGLAFIDTFTVTEPYCEPGKGAITPLPPLPTPLELPHTGSDSLNAWLVATASAVAVYGAVYFAQPKRRYE